MATNSDIPDYGWNETIPHTEGFLYKPLRSLLKQQSLQSNGSASLVRPTILDLGCGNGALVNKLQSWGYDVIGIDPSITGLEVARERNPNVNFYQSSADPISLAKLNLPLFDAVVSTEVVEHVYAPRLWAAAAHSVLKPGGILVCSTPYHGYFKNCAMAITGKLDSHFTALWDGGHIKFWSRQTLTTLLAEVGFEVVAFRGAGRLPFLWMSMLLVARKPLT